MRIMGLDIGTKRIGVAVSDETCTLAQGREIIERKSLDFVIKRIKELIDEFSVKEIVVGLPVNMNGTLGERAEDSKRISIEIEKQTTLPVTMWDERLSTKEVQDVMIQADISRKKRKKNVDKLAAQLILQGYLDSRV